MHKSWKILGKVSKMAEKILRKSAKAVRKASS